MTTPCNQIFEPLCVGYVGITYLHLQNFWALPLLFHKPFGGPETTSRGLGEELRNGSLPFAHTESLKGVSSFSGKLLSCPQIKQVEITLLLHRWLIGILRRKKNGMRPSSPPWWWRSSHTHWSTKESPLSHRQHEGACSRLVERSFLPLTSQQGSEEARPSPMGEDSCTTRPCHQPCHSGSAMPTNRCLLSALMHCGPNQLLDYQ